MAATVIVALFYLIVIFSDFLATNDPEDIEAARQYTPPQWLRVFDGWKPDLHVCRLVGSRDEFLRKVYVKDCDQKVDVQIFARGYEYSLIRAKAGSTSVRCQ